MFFGDLRHWSTQRHYLPLAVVQALDRLQTLDLTTYDLGRHDLMGDHCFFWYNENQTQAAPLFHPEVHHLYADVQVLLSGEERIDLWHPQDAPLIDDRLAHDDLGFFEALPAPSSLILRPNMFVFIPPYCPHQPLIQVHEPVTLRKVVIKIHRELLISPQTTASILHP